MYRNIVKIALKGIGMARGVAVIVMSAFKTLDVNAGISMLGMGGDTGTGYHAFFIGTLDSKLVVTALVNTEEGDVISPSMAALESISQQIESK